MKIRFLKSICVKELGGVTEGEVYDVNDKLGAEFIGHAWAEQYPGEAGNIHTREPAVINREPLIETILAKKRIKKSS